MANGGVMARTAMVASVVRIGRSDCAVGAVHAVRAVSSSSSSSSGTPEEVLPSTASVPQASPLWQSMGAAKTALTGEKVIMRAHGSTLVDSSGRSVIDAVAGLWCVNLGYSNDAVKRAIAEQTQRLPYASNFAGSTCPSAVEAATAVQEFLSEDGVHRVLFTSGGSDAVETSLKLARQYWKLAGQPGRTKFFSLKRGYHGTHFGGASVNGNARFRQAYEPLLPGCHHLPTPCTYRNPFDERDGEELARRIAAHFEEELQFHDPETVAAFIMEPVLGAGGVIVPPPSFMRLMRAVCDKYGVLMIADEVITGFGRTGAWSGSRGSGMQPDMMCVAKGLTSAYFPVGALCLNKRVAEVFEGNTLGPKSAVNHGYTYSAHPVGAAAAAAAIEQYATVRAEGDIDLATNAALRGKQMYEGALKLKERFPERIGDVRGGRGLMTGIEIVSDAQSKTPMDAKTMKRLHLATYEAGAQVRIALNTICLSPPLIITEAEVDTILHAFEEGLATL